MIQISCHSDNRYEIRKLSFFTIRISYGNISPYLPPLKDINRREYYLLISLLIPIVIFGILPNILLDSLHMSVTSLIYTIPNPL